MVTWVYVYICQNSSIYTLRFVRSMYAPQFEKKRMVDYKEKKKKHHITHQSSQLQRNWKLLRWWENQLINLYREVGKRDKKGRRVAVYNRNLYNLQGKKREPYFLELNEEHIPLPKAPVSSASYSFLCKSCNPSSASKRNTPPSKEC